VTPSPISSRCRLFPATVVLAVLALPTGVLADVRVTDRMQAIESEITPRTLVVFDIDNTLIEGVETIAADPWYDYYLKKLTDGGMNEKEAVARANALWLRVQELATVRPVEAETVALIARLQAKGIKVMALTARANDAIALSKRQLASAGIDFTKSQVHNGSITFTLVSKAEYSDGVLYIDELNKKGEALAYFLRTTGVHPEKIVFADDKRKHADNVDLEMGKLGIPCVAYQYTRTYERTKSLDFSLADVQVQYLGKILPDDVAAVIKKSVK
jgi:FMN phosphatase YigB (HAD superfamily)